MADSFMLGGKKMVFDRGRYKEAIKVAKKIGEGAMFGVGVGKVAKGLGEAAKSLVEPRPVMGQKAKEVLKGAVKSGLKGGMAGKVGEGMKKVAEKLTAKKY